jgi:hypothetical protein
VSLRFLIDKVREFAGEDRTLDFQAGRWRAVATRVLVARPTNACGDVMIFVKSQLRFDVIGVLQNGSARVWDARTARLITMEAFDERSCIA